MLGQTTNSGSNNNTMAREMETMFLKADKPVSWDPQHYHVRCFAHKLGLVVKQGLKCVGIAAGHIKPTTPPNTSFPVPSIVLNDDLTELVCDESEDSDYDGEANLSQRPHVERTSDDEDIGYDDVPTSDCVVIQGAVKVGFP